jgi:hypothetical protein
MTPADAEVVEELLDALCTAGLPPAEAAVAYGALVGCLDGMLLAGYVTAASSEDWRDRARSFDPERYPRYAQIAPYAAGVSGPAIFGHGLDLLLAGIRAQAARAEP